MPSTLASRTLPSHHWVPLGHAFACKDCGLSSYEAEGIICPRRDVWTCGTQSNAQDHGTCFELFDTPQAANEHFLAAHHQPVTEAYLLGFERGRINAPRSEGDEYGGGSWTDDWRRGWDAGYEQWDGKRGFRDVF